jgi:exodeoxyribonuclease VII small subunit
MAKEPKRAEGGPAGLDELPYERLGAELEGVVKRLEAGDLSLADSLAAFERGVRLAQAAEGRLDAAEQRVEVLLHGDRTGPLPGEAPAGASAAPATEDDADDEVPF